MVILNDYTSCESMFVSVDFCYGYLHLVDAVISVLSKLCSRSLLSKDAYRVDVYAAPCCCDRTRGIHLVTTSSCLYSSLVL